MLSLESPTIIVNPEDTWGAIGKRTVLHCLAKGDNPMTYTWYKDNVLMTSTGDLETDKAVLVFLETIPEDAGEYFCKAKNKVSDAKSKKARLQVYSKYHWRVVVCTV